MTFQHHEDALELSASMGSTARISKDRLLEAARDARIQPLDIRYT